LFKRGVSQKTLAPLATPSELTEKYTAKGLHGFIHTEYSGASASPAVRIKEIRTHPFKKLFSARNIPHTPHHPATSPLKHDFSTLPFTHPCSPLEKYINRSLFVF
jgi:hypothetical protein